MSILPQKVDPSVQTLINFAQALDFRAQFQDVPPILIGVDRSENKPKLVLVYESELTFLERIQRFFGFSKFQLSKVTEITQNILTNNLSETDKISVTMSIEYLRTKLESPPKSLYERLFHHKSQKKQPPIKPKVELFATPINPLKRTAIDLPGLRNPGCLCYGNATIVSLWGCEQFRHLLNRVVIENKDNPVANALYNVFLALDFQDSSTPLDHNHGLLQALDDALIHKFLYLSHNHYTMQDANELLRIILDEIDPNYSYQLLNRSKRLLDTPLSDYERAASQLYIPSYDSTILAPTDQFPTELFNDTSSLHSLSEMFKGFTFLEHFEVADLLRNDENKNKEIPAAITAEYDLKTKTFPPVRLPTQRQIMLDENSPPFLPIAVPRFHNTGQTNWRGEPIYEKGDTTVAAPYRLIIPKKDDIHSAVYILRSVTVHTGSKSLNSGHYQALFPELSTLDKNGNPTHWIYASDSSKKQRWIDEEAQEFMKKNATQFFYDLVEDNVPNSC
jgi:ubiquitin C-terminal hydrolase